MVQEPTVSPQGAWVPSLELRFQVLLGLVRKKKKKKKERKEKHSSWPLAKMGEQRSWVS